MPEPTRPLLRDAFLGRPGRGQWVAAGLLFVLGLAGATQVSLRESDEALSSLRQSDLIRAFDGLASATERAEKQIEELRTDRDRLRDSTNSREAALEVARQEQLALSILAGVVAAKGPGVRIVITDPEGTVSAGVILDMVQELRATGAEAMEFNDTVRIVAQTSFEETEEGLALNGELVEAPYVVDVIGAPGALSGAVDFPYGPMERVEDAGGVLTVEERDELVVESVAESRKAGFAEPQDDR